MGDPSMENRSISMLRPRLLFVILLSFTIFYSCASTTPSYPVTRYWDLKYKEALKIMTEPSGCRIYVEGSRTDFVGLSPVTTTLNDDLRVVQSGYHNGTSGITTWYDTFEGSANHGGWTIKAYCEGYRPSEMRINSSKTNAFKEAIQELSVSDDGRLPTTVIGHNSVLLALEPLHSSSSKGTERPTSTTGLTGSAQRSSDCAQKQRDYEVALAAYRSAIDRYNINENLSFLNDLNWANEQYAPPGLHKGMSFLGMLSSRGMKQDAANDIDIARHNLSVAKARLCY